ncbi:MAG: type II toxin-antitoxin system RelE/ParE family toxin [Fluviicoccus sp.]|uniref:type II toxin-antitoxin system RelE/ParE family toxin n=1 Tax=Fluviicoccus sp. TaxID=2003552 RepID=UPI00271EB8E9|nr:type II toxin-antitoxin system RelE/ParE family toxin [Fluviicoccus sp.]MDO8331920.1 type II toxin-antitoxin system RelE/ParE family toxin [Fluviicoccus sp.]
MIVALLPEFEEWLDGLKDGLKDGLTRRRLALRLRKAELGNLGDIKPVGEGVWEMREFFGPGWRMYYIQRGDLLIVMLGGGDKSTQQRDIEKAIELSRNVED